MTDEDKSSNLMMTQGNILKKLLLLSIPIILGNLLQQMYNTVDSIIVGKYVGSIALASVGASTFLIQLLIAFSQGVSVGAGVIVSQYLGAGNKEGTHNAVHTAFGISFVLGLILNIGGVIFSRQLLVLMNTPQDVFADADTYFKIYAGGIFFNVAYNMAAGILNASGNSRRALVYLAAASFTNIVLDIIFIRYCNMGVEGAAIATDISQLISFILAFIYLLRTSQYCKVILSHIRIQKNMAVRIIRIGIPTGIQNMVISLSNIIVQTGINSFGAIVMAGFGVYLKIDGFNILPVQGLALSITTFAGQNYGAGLIDRVRKGTIISLVMSIVYTIVTGCLLAAFSHNIISLFSSDEGVIWYGKLAIHRFCYWYWIIGILQLLCGAVRGTGKGMPPMIIMLISLCLFRIVWMSFILPFLSSGVEGIYIMYPISWAVGLVLMLLYLWKCDWLNQKNCGDANKRIAGRKSS